MPFDEAKEEGGHGPNRPRHEHVASIVKEILAQTVILPMKKDQCCTCVSGIVGVRLLAAHVEIIRDTYGEDRAVELLMDILGDIGKEAGLTVDISEVKHGTKH